MHRFAVPAKRKPASPKAPAAHDPPIDLHGHEKSAVQRCVALMRLLFAELRNPVTGFTVTGTPLHGLFDVVNGFVDVSFCMRYVFSIKTT